MLSAKTCSYTGSPWSSVSSEYLILLHLLITITITATKTTKVYIIIPYSESCTQ